MVFDEFGEQPVYTLHDIPRGADNSNYSDLSMQVQYGQINVVNGSELIVLEQIEEGYELGYWRRLDGGTELGRFGGGLLLANSQGSIHNPSSHLVLSHSEPASGTALASGESVHLQFSNLINTDGGHLAANIRVTDSNDVALSGYAIDGVNSLAGGVVTVTFDETFATRDKVLLQVSDELLDIHGNGMA